MTAIDKNSKIKESYARTIAKRKTQSCKVYTLKIQKNKLNKVQQTALKMLFVEAKWLYNHVLNLSETQSVFDIKYTDIPKVTHYDKDKNKIESSLSYLSSQMKQGVLDAMRSSIRGLAARKANNGKIGKLKFISEYKSINLKQANVSYKFVGKSKVKIQGIKKPLRVNGLEQITRLPEYDLANAKLIQRNGDYYLAVTVYVNKTETKNNAKPRIGIDFGCQTSLTLSDGTKYNCVVEETERIKELKQRASRAMKGSNNKRKLLLQIRRKNERLTNKKSDLANKICHNLKRYQVVMQDEQLSQWSQRGHGKAVTNGILGRVKRILTEREDTIVLSKWCPTTKLCVECGTKVPLSQWDRQFVCPHCGKEHDRDVHAAENMLWFAKNKIGVGRTCTLDEIRHSIEDFFNIEGVSLSQEAANPLGWR